MVSLLWVPLKKEPETRLWVLLASQAGDHSERGTKKKSTRANTTELGTLMEKWHSMPLEVLWITFRLHGCPTKEWNVGSFLQWLTLFHWLKNFLMALTPLSLCYTWTWVDQETEEKPSMWIKTFEQLREWDLLPANSVAEAENHRSGPSTCKHMLCFLSSL